MEVVCAHVYPSCPIVGSIGCSKVWSLIFTTAMVYFGAVWAEIIAGLGPDLRVLLESLQGSRTVSSQVLPFHDARWQLWRGPSLGTAQIDRWVRSDVSCLSMCQVRYFVDGVFEDHAVLFTDMLQDSRSAWLFSNILVLSDMVGCQKSCF